MSLTREDAQALLGFAGRKQVDPVSAYALMLLESNGNPNVYGGADGNYYGSIQFGREARREVGLPDRPGPMTLAQQMPYVERYFDQRGFQPGKHGVTELYRTVLVGNPHQSGTDSFGTNSDSAARRMMPGGDLYERASAALKPFMGDGAAAMSPPTATPAATAPTSVSPEAGMMAGFANAQLEAANRYAKERQDREFTNRIMQSFAAATRSGGGALAGFLKSMTGGPRMAGDAMGLDRAGVGSVARGATAAPANAMNQAFAAIMQAAQSQALPAASASSGTGAANAIQPTGGRLAPAGGTMAMQGPQGGRIPGGAFTRRARDPDAEATGWDIVHPGGRGAPILAPVDLVITGTGFQGEGAGETGRGYGNWVSGEFDLDGKRHELLIGHLDEIGVKPGMTIPAGTPIGKQGITGRAFGTHATTHVNPRSGASVDDAWSALDRLTRIWERGR